VPPPPPVSRAAHARSPRSAPLALAAAGSARAAALSGVLELTPQNFEASLAGRRVLVEMYAPWCPYCAKLEPLWAALPAELARTPGAPRLRHRTRLA
jgi:thioredoxin-like negative regulator of GroEL